MYIFGALGYFGQSADDLPEPGVIALRIMERLETAMEEMAALKDLLEVEEIN